MAERHPDSEVGQAAARTRLVLLFGGQSAEHDVSCTTAAHVLAAIDTDRFEPVPVGITADGSWVRADGALELLAANGGTAPDKLVPAGPATSLEPLRADGPVVVFPLLHGPRGEDGTVQGLLELADVPYVGAGVLGSALAMDKAKAKEALAWAGVPQARWITVNGFTDDLTALAERVGEELGYPAFVKPANMGSSVGVSRVAGPDGLADALETALRYDEWVVVEAGVDGREIELAVLGNHELEVSVPGEIVPADEFYSYDDKYVDGAADLRIPADLPAEAVAELQHWAKVAFRALRGEGMGRADFFWTDDGPLFNELNTIPGFTPISMYPKLWQASGLGYAELISRLVDLAVERHARRARTRTVER